MADIRITPALSLISFSSASGYTETLTQSYSGGLSVFGSGTTGRYDIFSVDGTNGRLLSVTDDLSSSLFSVNTVAGIPVFELFANNDVNIGQYGSEPIKIVGSTGNVLIGTPPTDNGQKLQIYSNSTNKWLYLSSSSGNPEIESATGFLIKANSGYAMYTSYIRTALNNVDVSTGWGDLNINSSGNVLIATSSDNSSGAKLQVSGDATVKKYLKVGDIDESVQGHVSIFNPEANGWTTITSLANNTLSCDNYIVANGYKIQGAPHGSYLLADGSYTTSSGSVYKGQVDGSTKVTSPDGITLSDGTGTAGNYYACSASGTSYYNSGGTNQITLLVGDQIYYNGSIWLKIPGAGSYTLPDATNSTKGGIIVGAGLAITSGTLRTNLSQLTVSGHITMSGGYYDGNFSRSIQTDGTSANTFNSLVARNASNGGFSAGPISATSFNSITGLGSSNPLMDGSADGGTSTLVARQDHVHPSDTSRQASLGYVPVSQDSTYLGKIGYVPLDSVTNTPSLWSALPVGYSRMMSNSLGISGGTPADGIYGYFTKIANRDAGNGSNGWSGLWTGYAGGDSYIGQTTDGNTFATWSKIWTSSNFTPSDYQTVLASTIYISTGSTYTLQLTDSGKKLNIDSEEVTITIPSSVFPSGSQIIFKQMNGQLSFVGESGVTIHSAGSMYKTTQQYSVCQLIYEGSNTWTLFGDLKV